MKKKIKKSNNYKFPQAEKEAEFWGGLQMAEEPKQHVNIYSSGGTLFYYSVSVPELLLEFDSIDEERYCERLIENKSWFDAGYVWAPYIPTYVTPAVWISEPDFKPRKKISRRYKNKKIKKNYYGSIDL